MDGDLKSESYVIVKDCQGHEIQIDKACQWTTRDGWVHLTNKHNERVASFRDAISVILFE